MGHKQHSHARFYALVITVVILWPPYKVEHHPQTYPAAYVPQHTSDSTRRPGELARPKAQTRQFCIKKAEYFGSTENNKKIKSHNKQRSIEARV